MFYNYFCGIFSLFSASFFLDPVLVAGVPQPFDQFPSRVAKVNMFKLLKCAFISTQMFEVEVSQLFLLDLSLILSFSPKLTVK